MFTSRDLLKAILFCHEKEIKKGDGLCRKSSSTPHYKCAEVPQPPISKSMLPVPPSEMGGTKLYAGAL